MIFSFSCKDHSAVYHSCEEVDLLRLCAGQRFGYGFRRRVPARLYRNDFLQLALSVHFAERAAPEQAQRLEPPLQLRPVFLKRRAALSVFASWWIGLKQLSRPTARQLRASTTALSSRSQERALDY